jgi:hypothetical protein
MLPAGFEPAIPASERAQTHALDRADAGIGSRLHLLLLLPVKILLRILRQFMWCMYQELEITNPTIRLGLLDP